MREGGLNQSGVDIKGDKMWSDSDHILKVESTAFADGLDIECEGDRNRDVIFPYF